jgi:tRNA(fMet)-specific endonuclease VapC
VIAFDTDILSDLTDRVPAVVSRAHLVPADQQFVPIVAAEEALRGQLANIRAAQAKPDPAALVRAYEYLDTTLALLRQVKTLPCTPVADALFRGWRSQGIRVGTRDLRIAAIAFAHNATLATHNARDFRLVPGLALDVWS